jgi:hypothetical protein
VPVIWIELVVAPDMNLTWSIGRTTVILVKTEDSGLVVNQKIQSFLYYSGSSETIRKLV